MPNDISVAWPLMSVSKLLGQALSESVCQQLGLGHLHNVIVLRLTFLIAHILVTVLQIPARLVYLPHFIHDYSVAALRWVRCLSGTRGQ